MGPGAGRCGGGRGADEQLLWEPVLAWPLREWGPESAEGLPHLLTGLASILSERDQLLLGISAGGSSHVTPGNLRPPCQARMVTQHRHRV